jgi:hypothetical protein
MEKTNAPKLNMKLSLKKETLRTLEDSAKPARNAADANEFCPLTMQTLTVF